MRGPPNWPMAGGDCAALGADTMPPAGIEYTPPPAAPPDAGIFNA